MKRMMAAAVAVVLSVCPVRAAITRGPVLQPTADLEHRVGVMWRTANSVSGTIKWGVSSVNENSATAPAGTEHFIELASLAPGTTYKYQVIADGTTTPVYGFKTSSATETRRVIALADVHAPSPKEAPGWVAKQESMLPDMVSFAPDLIVIAGDIVDDGNVPEQYDTLFKTYRDLFASAIVAPSPGNHEWAKRDTDLSIYTSQWHLPENCPGYGERTYCFDYAGIRWVSLENRGSIFKELEVWLKLALAAPKANFIVAYHHYPVYLSCQWDDEMAGNITDEVWKAPLRTLLETHAVDLDLAGHRHFYQRTLPILSSLPSPPCVPPVGSGWGGPETAETTNYKDPAGVIYIQMFSTRAQREGALYKRPYFACCGPEAQVNGPSWMGYGTIVVSGRTLTFDGYAYSLDGSVRRKRVDHFVLDKTAAGHP